MSTAIARVSKGESSGECALHALSLAAWSAGLLLDGLSGAVERGDGQAIILQIDCRPMGERIKISGSRAAALPKTDGTAAGLPIVTAIV